MKKLHLICNSHIDPVWQWDWNEGLAAAISTFWQAVRFSEEFDYIFCHNESLLFEYIERVDPSLFEEIKRLVKAGKWHIMGGWYLQPDCNAISGESFVRQIEVGRKYFKSRFGVTPTVALNFDSFGHSTGMPQILSKTGHNGYLFCRPMKFEQKFDMREFMWVSMDGSKIKAARAQDDMVYISRFGKALEDINRKIGFYEDLDYGVALWGVGNHGGVNSRKDLEDVTKLIKETKDFDIVHSTPEDYFNDINPSIEYRGPVQPQIIGSYTSMNNIKALNGELERKLFNTEKLVSFAEIKTGYKPDYNKLEEATKAMLKIQFHDALAGTICSDGEKSCIEIGKGALATLERIQDEAYLSIVLREKQANPDENPVFLFNYLPYKRKAICETEILLMDGMISDTEELYFKVYQNGKLLRSQRIKELGNLNFDRRIRTAFECELEPLNATRVDFIVDKRAKTTKPIIVGDFKFDNGIIKARINAKTGLLDKYTVNGKEMLSGGAFEPILSYSTENPWGHELLRTTSNKQPFSLSSCNHGLVRGLKQMKVVEDGDLFTVVQSIFESDDSIVIHQYKFYKHESYIDVHSVVFFNAKDRAIEFKVPTTLDGRYFGQVAYGTEYFERDNCDKPTHRFVGFEDGEKALTIYNDNVYCSMVDGNDLYLLALNGAVHAGHLILNRPIVKEPDRYVPYIEQGKHEFNFRLSFDDKTSLEKNSEEFLSVPFGYNLYPHGDGNLAKNLVEVSNSDIVLKAFYKEDDHYVLRFINNSVNEIETDVKINNETIRLMFNRFEVKTLIYNLKNIEERRNFISN